MPLHVRTLHRGHFLSVLDGVGALPMQLEEPKNAQQVTKLEVVLAKYARPFTHNSSHESEQHNDPSLRTAGIHPMLHLPGRDSRTCLCSHDTPYYAWMLHSISSSSSEKLIFIQQRKTCSTLRQTTCRVGKRRASQCKGDSTWLSSLQTFLQALTRQQLVPGDQHARPNKQGALQAPDRLLRQPFFEEPRDARGEGCLRSVMTGA